MVRLDSEEVETFVMTRKVGEPGTWVVKAFLCVSSSVSETWERSDHGTTAREVASDDMPSNQIRYWSLIVPVESIVVLYGQEL